jgi:hypothetical protein
MHFKGYQLKYTLSMQKYYFRVYVIGYDYHRTSNDVRTFDRTFIMINCQENKISGLKINSENNKLEI